MGTLKQLGIILRRIYDDDDMLQLAIAASDGVFSGITEPYIDRSSLIDVASELEAFPKSSTAEYVFEFSEHSGQRTSYLRFYIRDRVGHAAVHCLLHGGTTNERCCAEFFVATEVAQINEAGKQLRQLVDDREAEVTIRQLR